MKLMYVIISNDDSERVIHELNKEGYQATRLSTTGGFLKKGNTTLMVVTEDERVEKAAELVEKVCGKRQTIDVDVPYVNYPVSAPGVPLYCNSVKQRVEVGGAVIFAVDVCYYSKI